ncbi:MAG: hypothetical protein H0W64_06955 [Gammaproteobacteria bacterium]|nr:hypothetical protein [Gammaproteobacteria bacterium]
MLSQKLKQISPDRLTINIASLEPVPGNFISSVNSDLSMGMKKTLAASVADLTDCKNMANLLVLFTNRPLPDIACQAPILPSYPQTCHAEVDVTPGCHKTAVSFIKTGDDIIASNDESRIAFHRIIESMKRWGTSFDATRLNFEPFLKFSNDSLNDANKDQLLKLYGRVLPIMDFFGDEHRAMHLQNHIYTCATDKKYLNRHHQQLSDVQNPSDDDCVLTMLDRNPKPKESQSQVSESMISTSSSFFTCVGNLYNRLAKSSVWIRILRFDLNINLKAQQAKYCWAFKMK